MSKKRYGKKIREQEEATAHVFQDFLTSFQGVSSTSSKVFIKSGTLNPAKSNSTENPTESGQLYIPKPIISTNDVSLKTAIDCAKILKDTKITKKKNKEKPLSNLELLKEEIKQRQQLKTEEIIPTQLNNPMNDPSSTNLFVANLNSKITEEQLMVLFGKFGPLASVKILWPRGEEKFRNFPNKNCGFVAFMSRKDAERALEILGKRDDMRVSWGKCIEVPPTPIYIPPELTKLFLPPPLSGLPFNAQPPNKNFVQPTNNRELEELLSSSIVKVTIPLDRKMLCMIHRTIEFVIKEGPLMEALIMMNEIRNPNFSFLFDNKSPLHVYYRWKLFSILNGDGQKRWSLKPFRMVENGPIWIPPVPMDYTLGMPDSLIQDEGKKYSTLSDSQCKRLIDLIRNLDMSRSKIVTAMSFCISHISAIDDSLNIINESLRNNSTNPVSKIARLYLLSDVFWNCHKKKIDLFKYESDFLEETFINLHETFNNLTRKFDKDNFLSRIKNILKCWQRDKIFSSSFVEKLGRYFSNEEFNDDDELSSDEPLDGANLLKRSSSAAENVTIAKNFDSHFIPSPWSRVDPKDLESQAMSTHKLFELELCQSEREKKKKKKSQKPSYSFTVSSKWDSDDE